MVKKTLCSNNSKGRWVRCRALTIRNITSSLSRTRASIRVKKLQSMSSSESKSSSASKRAKKIQSSSSETSSSASKSAKKIQSSSLASKIAKKTQSSPSKSSDGEKDTHADDDLKSLLRRKYSLLKDISKHVDLPNDYDYNYNYDYGYDYDNNAANGKDEGPWFKDFSGIDAVLDELKMKLISPLHNLQIPHHLQVRSLMSGILLHGPPGCGKTTLAEAIANEAGIPFYKTSATELVSSYIGESEQKIRELFSKAHNTSPSVVFIDEIDAIASTRGNRDKAMEKLAVTQLMTSMDNTSKNKRYVLVIGATNRPDDIDPALRRPGRFEREFHLGVPDENARIKILSSLTQNIKLEGGFDLVKIARATPGFVGADLVALVNEAGLFAMKRSIERKMTLSTNNENWWREKYTWTPEELDNCSHLFSDFEAAAKLVQPSSKREGFSSIPDVKWEDVGGHDLLRKKFYDNIVAPIQRPGLCEKFGLDLKTGFLLHGPPGSGKTLIAKAVANEAGANFIHIQGPELLRKYVGESESALRTVFRRARTCTPCILFFDEIDAIAIQRGKDGSVIADRLLTQLLTELDGGHQRNGVFVIAATNRLKALDPAVLRPGWLGKRLYVPLPNQHERELILKALTRNKPLDADVDLIAIARSKTCANLSGADLAEVVEIVKVAAFKEACTTSVDDMPSTIKAAHFDIALREIEPSVSEKE